MTERPKPEWLGTAVVAEAVPVRVKKGPVGTDLAESVAALEFNVGSQRVRELERVSTARADVLFSFCENTHKKSL